MRLSSIPTLVNVYKFAKYYNPQKIPQGLKKAERGGFAMQFTTLLKMIGDRDFKLNPSTKLIYLGALAYVIMPFDAIPDYLPGIGLLDDAAVLQLVWNYSLREINRYLALKGEKNARKDLRISLGGGEKNRCGGTASYLTSST